MTHSGFTFDKGVFGCNGFTFDFLVSILLSNDRHLQHILLSIERTTRPTSFISTKHFRCDWYMLLTFQINTNNIT